MTTYEKLKEIIIEARPDIMELKFGCKVSTEDGYFIIGSPNITMTSVYKNTENEVNYYTTEFGRKQITKENFEIIGRDINIEDILIVFEKKYGTAKENIKNRNEKNSLNWMNIHHYWQLGKPLHEQSIDTQKYLLEILDK